MSYDFDSRPPTAVFPQTRPSAIGALSSDDPAERACAFEILVNAYWRPVYAHIRLKWRRSAEDAADATQGFFARALERAPFEGYDSDRARFRAYLKGSLDKYMLELARGASRKKRGGGIVHVNVDFAAMEHDLEELGVFGPSADAADLDAHFDREWTRGLFSSAVAALEEQCQRNGKSTYFEVFRRYVLEPEIEGGERVSYADVASACAITVNDVTNYLAWTRRELRLRLLDRLREITSSEEELREEAWAVLGVEP